MKLGPPKSSSTFWQPSINEITSHQQIRSEPMIKPSAFSRVVVITLTSVLSLSATIAQQDISGGAVPVLAGAEVEAKLGKGIFTPVQNRAHAAKPLEKKTVARSAHTSRQTTAGNRQGNNSGRG